MILNHILFVLINLKADVHAPASIHNILICIPSLKHILGLFSLTKLRSRCNMIHLMPLLKMNAMADAKTFHYHDK